ncbi:MAG TPA: hypothetical protein PLD20_13470 [Blastocatellia bacterium]|nr:hypothetical protein [Blastocatellia bacterium]HMV87308.1 hypothetical protein [Blastocatellia bacterium]HMX24528.1 hypothetical protein [Blastocatellia bacterium]HMY71619.1 hypothetical protein [Blastocatellia bacterium]HMZ18940.1 hypothetical protein [Blastocatellia bacterium]
MYAIEFQTKVESGRIEIPAEFKDQLAGYVRVIVLTEEKQAKINLLDRLLANPIKLDCFEPLTREEIHEQS